jgi:hypothetical protein
LLLLLGPEVEGLQGEHVSLDIFRIVVPVSDVSTAAELGNVLEFTGPDSAIRPRVFEPSSIVEVPRYGWLTVTIIEPAHGVTISIPARIVVALAGVGIVDQITISAVSKDISRVVGDDVENDVDSMIVGNLHEIAQFLARPKMGVDIKKILDTITVIAGFERDLAKTGLTHREVTPRRFK